MAAKEKGQGMSRRKKSILGVLAGAIFVTAMLAAAIAPRVWDQITMEQVGGVAGGINLTAESGDSFSSFNESETRSSSPNLQSSEWKEVQPKALKAAPQSAGQEPSRSQGVGQETNTASPASISPAELKRRTLEGDRHAARVSAQQRIIIHDANINITVDRLSEKITIIRHMAIDEGGWVIESNNESANTGSITIRIPAHRLYDIMERIAAMAHSVDRTGTSSRDVTDEYIDLNARLNIEEQNLRALMARQAESGDSIENILSFYQVINDAQTEVEKLKGRINFLTESSAFSKLTVNLALRPTSINVEMNTDRVTTTVDPVKAEVIFEEVPGVDQYQTVIDFGSGSAPLTSRRSLPMVERPGYRRATTAVHQYTDNTYSPFIITATVTGEGNNSEVHGEATSIIEVYPDPTLNLNLVREDDIIKDETTRITANFTRPTAMSNFRAVWTPGDGSNPRDITVPDGATTLQVEHTYQQNGEQIASLTLKADGITGTSERTEKVRIFVVERAPLVYAGIELKGVARGSVTALTGAIKFIGAALIAAVIFLPLWGPPTGAYIYFKRRNRKREETRRAQEKAPKETAEPDRKTQDEGE